MDGGMDGGMSGGMNGGRYDSGSRNRQHDSEGRIGRHCNDDFPGTEREKGVGEKVCGRVQRCLMTVPERRDGRREGGRKYVRGCSGVSLYC